MPVVVAPEFQAELAWLDVLVQREIVHLRAIHEISIDELRGVYIGDEQVDRLIEQKTDETADDPISRLTCEAEARRARIDGNSRLGRTSKLLGLAPFERDVLLLALAPKLDLKYETLYAYLNNSTSRRAPTVSLALRLYGRDEHVERARLDATAPLFRDGLLELEGDERNVDLGTSFSIAPALAAELQGLAPYDARLRGWVEVGADGSPLGVNASREDEERLARVAKLFRARGGLIVLEAEAALAPHAAARSLLRHLGRGALRLDADALSTERSLDGPLALVARLRGDGVYVDFEDVALERCRRSFHTLFASLARMDVPLVVSFPPGAPWKTLTRDLPVLKVTLETPNAIDRRAIWESALADEGVDDVKLPVADVAAHFLLGPAQIGAAARMLRLEAPFEDASAARATMFKAAREQSNADLGRLATRVPQRHAWSDLVLPAVVARRLHDLTDAIRARAKVFDEWGFGARSGRGLMALFAGASGTGKTMGAAVIARDIGLDLCRIDLANVVSKYIGETEKNLDRIFVAARRANAILFFDEADALLGKRSEVKDAHDRYANIEVAYLLQRMEDHDGVVILASNLAKNMDQAFARRMHFVIEFPRPDAALREQLWRRVFPSGVPIGKDVDFTLLARRYELAGGDVKTIALDAAFAAAAKGRAVEMGDLVSAASRQMLKQGKPMGGGEARIPHENAGILQAANGAGDGSVAGESTESKPPMDLVSGRDSP